jgi:hypothetical protein
MLGRNFSAQKKREAGYTAVGSLDEGRVVLFFVAILHSSLGLVG